MHSAQSAPVGHLPLPALQMAKLQPTMQQADVGVRNADRNTCPHRGFDRNGSTHRHPLLFEPVKDPPETGPMSGEAHTDPRERQPFRRYCKRRWVLKSRGTDVPSGYFLTGLDFILRSSKERFRPLHNRLPSSPGVRNMQAEPVRNMAVSVPDTEYRGEGRAKRHRGALRA